MPYIVKNGIEYFVNPNAIGAKELTVTTPEVQITAPKPYKESTLDKIANNINYAVSSVFRPVSRFLVNTFYQEPKDSYFLATRPFNYDSTPGSSNRDNIINVANGVVGQRNRLEQLGMTKVVQPNGEIRYYYKNPNYNQQKLDEAGVFDDVSEYEQYLRQCAQNANMFNSMVHKPTIGNAWDRHGVYGDSAIVVRPNTDKRNYSELSGINFNQVNRDNASYVKDNIDKADLKTGDIVDLSHSHSGYSRKAYEKGDYNRANTHTGSILKLGPRKQDTYVLHYQGKGIEIEPIGNLIGPSIWKANYITGIRRPGTKKHPYK